MPTDAIGHVVLTRLVRSLHFNIPGMSTLAVEKVAAKLHSSKNKKNTWNILPCILILIDFHNSYLKYKAGIRRKVSF